MTEHEHDAGAWDKHRRAPMSAARKGRVWRAAIALLDRSEIEIRDVIERGLVYVAALRGVKYGEAMRAADRVIARVSAIRTRAIKKAFRLIRDKGGFAQLSGLTVAQWAHHFAQMDAKRIDMAIRHGLISGLDNTEIARKVIGSSQLSGVDGVTEVMRQQMTHLGRAAIKQ